MGLSCQKQKISSDSKSDHSEINIEMSKFELIGSVRDVTLTDKYNLFRKNYPVHFEARRGSVEKIMKILESNGNHILQRDSIIGRTALHWSALNENIESGLKCTEKLLEFIENYLGNQTKLENFVNSKDLNGDTALHLATKNNSTEIVELLLDKYASFLILSKSGEEVLRLIYHHTPHALVKLFNKNINFLIDSNADRFFLHPFDRQYILDFTPIIGRSTLSNRELSFRFSNFQFIKKESELLNLVLEQGIKESKDILTHPLIRIFLQIKCKRLNIFFYISLLFHLFWLAIHTWVVYDVYYSCCSENVLKESNFSCWEYPFNIHQVHYLNDKYEYLKPINPLLRRNSHSSQLAKSALLDCVYSKDLFIRPTILFCISSIFFIKECFELRSMKGAYFNLENVVQFLFLTSLFLTVYPTEPFYLYQYQISAFSILFASSVLLGQVIKFRKKGIYVQVLIRVMRRFIDTIPILFVFLFTFSIALHMLFPEHNPSLSHFVDSLMTVFTMMAGKMKYKDEYRESIYDHYPVSGQILFSIFYIVIIMVFYRLLFGFIIYDTKKLQEEAEIKNLATTVEEIYLFETFILSKPIQHILRAFGLIDTLRKILISSNRNVKITMKENELPKKLRNDIRAIASNRITQNQENNDKLNT